MRIAELSLPVFDPEKSAGFAPNSVFVQRWKLSIEWCVFKFDFF
jgi:hypothetical protein